MDVIAGLAAVSQAIDIARHIRDVERQYDAVTLKGEIVDLMDKLMDVKGALQDARLEMDALKEEVDGLKRAAEVRAATMTFEGMRYLPSKDRPGEPQGSPFCIRCDQKDGRLITTVVNPKNSGSMCPDCKAEYVHAPIYFWDKVPVAE